MPCQSPELSPTFAGKPPFPSEPGSASIGKKDAASPPELPLTRRGGSARRADRSSPRAPSRLRKQERELGRTPSTTRNSRLSFLRHRPIQAPRITAIPSPKPRERAHRLAIELQDRRMHRPPHRPQR